VWLNSITSQFHVTLAVAVLAAAPVCAGRGRWLHRAVLLLAPLCGPVAGTLLPLFALRAWCDRSPARGWQAALLLPGLLVQGAVMLTHPEPAREIAALDLPVVLAAITGKQILLPLTGPGIANRLMLGVARWQWAAMLAPLLWFGAAGIAVWRGRDAPTRWLLATAVLVMAVSYGGALTPHGVRELVSPAFGLRYYVVPAVLGGWAALGVAASGRWPERALACALVAWLLAVGAVCYTRPAGMMAHGPAWPAEVAAWRADPAHRPAIWPDGWVVTLVPRVR
jgi:hypothetical protein